MIAPAPFPHLVSDGLWPDDLLSAVADEFPAVDAPGWRHYNSATESKLEGPMEMWGPMTCRLFGMFAEKASSIGSLFGFDDLAMETLGGGYHLIPPGGRLAVHTDFNISPDTRRYRVVNLLVYLNEDWTDPGGHLELWDDDRCVRSVAPEFNRTVMFATSSRSWHGHPWPAKRTRRSVAAYFFTAEQPADHPGNRSTVFHQGA